MYEAIAIIVLVVLLSVVVWQLVTILNLELAEKLEDSIF